MRTCVRVAMAGVTSVALALAASAETAGNREETTMKETTNTVTMKGKPLTLLGTPAKVGEVAPEFKVVDDAFKPVRLSDFAGKVVLVSAVPSLDTGVCSLQTRRFNEEAAKLPNDIVILTVSMDLPFAQARWCGAFGVDRVMMLSDHKNGSFGTNYGTLIKELRIESRAIFVVDQAGVIRHVEYVKEVADHPDYEATLKAARALVV